jgi:hypothetical protein
VTFEKHCVDLIPGTCPVRSRQKRLAPEKKEIYKKKLEQLVCGGFVISVTYTKWVSPVAIVPKKNRKWCVYVNYKALNDATKKDHFLVPYIDLDEVASHERYSSCDGYAGYHQVKVRKEDIYKTTFTTPWGTYVYLRMPFGMCNASGIFQWL